MPWWLWTVAVFASLSIVFAVVIFCSGMNAQREERHRDYEGET
jgi:hypothetical protein